MTIKKRINYLHNKGWTYKKIAKLMNVSTSSLYRYRKNKVKNPKKIKKWFRTHYIPGKRYLSQLGDKTGFDFKKKTYIRTKGTINLTKNNYIDFKLTVFNDISKRQEIRWYRYGMSDKNQNTLNNQIQKVLRKLVDDYKQKTYHIILLKIEYDEIHNYKYHENKQFYKIKEDIGKFNVKK